ncbi:MAG: hypothetical protein A3G93_08590 [Nitrospinae bacterium RIFCSPLOWO2_12_FULL_45_22]|nr:MAG: hypothetical protein A3G93_08590 [Nitrospinae bacterium RIFCSPLOWO2_12_FULL_45_22]
MTTTNTIKGADVSMTTIKKFEDTFTQRDMLARKWKQEGRALMGWVCTYVPEEIIYAAGALPIRVLGGAQETPLADATLYSNACSFIRNCLEMGLDKRYDSLDGLVSVNTCDHIRRFFDVWTYHIPMPFKIILSVPTKVTENTIRFFTQELSRFRHSLEEFTGNRITIDSLRSAIGTYNRTRILLGKLYEKKKSLNPPLTGTQTLHTILAGMVMPKDQYNVLLEELLQEIETKGSGISQDGKLRLMVCGSELEHPEFLELIEQSGGLVVADDLCNGARYFWGMVDPEEEPLNALARRYLSRFPCPRMHPLESRVQYIVQMAQDFAVDGVIYEVIKFCDLHANTYPLIKKGLQEVGVPVLKLEREYLFSATGQLKTRIQAFFENISSARI